MPLLLALVGVALVGVATDVLADFFACPGGVLVCPGGVGLAVGVALAGGVLAALDVVGLPGWSGFATAVFVGAAEAGEEVAGVLAGGVGAVWAVGGRGETE